MAYYVASNPAVSLTTLCLKEKADNFVKVGLAVLFVSQSLVLVLGPSSVSANCPANEVVNGVSYLATHYADSEISRSAKIVAVSDFITCSCGVISV